MWKMAKAKSERFRFFAQKVEPKTEVPSLVQKFAPVEFWLAGVRVYWMKVRVNMKNRTSL